MSEYEPTGATRTERRDAVVGPLTKGLRLDSCTSAVALLHANPAGKPKLTDDLFSWPLLTLDDRALDHNIGLMARLCAEHGVEHAPHVKTAMSRGIFARQLAAGAWGATVATPAQLRAVRSWGAQRIFLANELVDPREIAWLRREIERSSHDNDQALEVWTYVDSAEGVALLARGFAGASPQVIALLGVLVELGVPAGRTGARSPAEALGLARAVRSGGLRLLGVAGYEGSVAGGTGRDELRAVAAWCRDLRDLGSMLRRDGLAGVTEPLVLSAGGSSFLDVVLAELPGPLPAADRDGGTPVRVVVRSGAYVTHDHGFCARMDTWDRIRGGEAMHPAITVWAQVLSVPEPGLVICGIGRRDVSSDIDLPVALHLRTLDRSGRLLPPRRLTGARVTALNDQHLFLAVHAAPVATQPPAALPRPGDVIGFGISHPCTTLDKWRVAAIVSGDEVLDLVTTDF